jgi:acyl carrier protein
MWHDTVEMVRDPRVELHDILASRFRPPRPGELSDELDLGSAGFGLDSISLIELLLVCEEQFGCEFPATLFDGGPLTVGRLLDRARASTGEPEAR